ncbi:hypothetical protein B0I35DRAFT_446643 [Stachybotrys elegans]|uniref:Extracellular membrane protein CFEM domain-containing protein n=1 Tax=Stachybotrys elegans TaxID=80388 RepID=A0A8K0S8I4_9HYPO|nr:hypothetical protein B0I35DRAFT_446643 [Stachybotrys elegans]
MVRILSAITVLLSIAIGAQAQNFCQCLYSDGSHCCVADNRGGCTESCMNVKPLFADNPCNAGGKWSKVSAWNAQFRRACND